MKLVKVKYDNGSLGRNVGCRKAPDYLVENGEFVDVDNGNVDETMIAISKLDGDFFIGGDHSITYGSLKGFASKIKNPGIIIFDAHPDCYPEDFLNHENWIYYLIKEEILKKENIILVGLRAIDEKEKLFLDKNEIKYFTMDAIFMNEENVCDSVMELGREFEGLYLSIDIDVLDPAFAPGTGYLEAGGMNLNRLLYFLKRIRKMRNLRRIDLTEINPDKDANGMTIKCGKRIIGAFMG